MFPTHNHNCIGYILMYFLGKEFAPEIIQKGWGKNKLNLTTYKYFILKPFTLLS